MKHLRTLARVAMMRGFKVADDRGNEGDATAATGVTGATKVRDLFRAIREGRVRTDSEARELLYPERGYVPLTTFQSVKTRLHELLVETIAAGRLTKDHASESEIARSQMLRFLQAVHTLETLGETDAARRLALRALRLAHKYAWTDHIIGCLETLVTYPAEPGDVTETATWASELGYWRTVRAAEDRAWSMVHTTPPLTLWELHSESQRHDLERRYADVGADLATYGTHALVEASFMLRCALHQGSQQYEDLIRTVSEHRLYDAENPHLARRQGMVRMTLAVMMAHLWSGDPEQAHRLLRECESLVREGTPLWFDAKEHAMVVWLRSGKLHEAETLCDSMTQHLEESDEQRRLTWRVLAVYLRFLRESSGEPRSGRSSDSEEGALVRTSVTDGAMHRDSPGFNAVHVIARVLEDFLDGRYEKLSLRDESLQAFRRKKLRLVSKRVDVFLRLLHLLVECDFDGRRSETRGARLWAELRTPRLMHDRGEADMLEIVPFDEVWTGMLRILRERKEVERTTVS
ncbi:MAG: hypothetical protein ACKOB6_04705 [Candidatus Kapaibacterium sp.]